MKAKYSEVIGFFGAETAQTGAALPHSSQNLGSMNTNSKPVSLSAGTSSWALSRWLAGAVALCLVTGTFSSWGATKTWTGAAGGSDFNWGTTANWSEGSIPGTGDDIIFPVVSDSVKTPVNNIVGLALHSVTFTSSGYIITGNGVSISGGVTNTSGAGDQFDCPMTMTASQTFDLIGSVTFNGTIANDYALTVSVATDRLGLFGGVLSGTGSLTKLGGGTLDIKGHINTYTGKTLVTGGTLYIDRESSLGGNPSTFTADQLKLDGGTLQVNNNAIIGAANMNSGVTLGASGGTFLTDPGVVFEVQNEITGSGTLTKTGTGTAKLSAVNSGINTYTGKTTVLEGVLSIDDVNRLGNDPGTFTADQLTINGGTLNAFGTFSFNNNVGVTLGASGGTVSVNIGKVLTVAKAVAGSGSLTKTLGGKLKLSVANSYTGRTIVSAGILSIDGEDRLGANPGSATANQLEIASGAELNAFGSFTIDDSNRGITLDSGTATISVDSGVNLTVANVIAGSGGALTKTGTGVLTLTGVNTYSGATTVSAGKLLGRTGGSCSSSAVSASANATNGVAITANSITWACGNVTYNANSGVDFNFGSVVPSTSAANAPLQISGNISFSGTPVVYIEAGSLPSGAGTYPLIHWTGTSSGTQPTVWANKPSRVTATLTSDANNIYLNVTGSTEPLTYYGTDSKNWGAASVWKDNTGTTVTFANNDSVQMMDWVSSGAYPFTITIATTVNVLPTSVLVSNVTKDYTIAASSTGVIGGSCALTKIGSGTLTLDSSLANTYSGGTFLSDGKLVVNNPSSLGAGTFTITGGTIDTTTGITLSTYNNPEAWNGDFTFAGSGNLNLGTGAVALGGNRQVTVSSRKLTVGGVISDNGSSYSLTKAGGGTMALTGASTYSGNTTVSGGTLQVDGSTASGSAVTVDNGAILCGLGTVAGSVVVNGTIIPDDNGGSPGTLNTGAETWNGGGSYQVTITHAAGTAGADPGWDLLNISGALAVAATTESKFTIVLGPAPAVWNNTANYNWLIATASGGVTGFDASKFAIDDTTFAGLKGTGHFSINKAGNNVYLQFGHVTTGAVTVTRAWGTDMRISVATVLEQANTSGGTGPYTVTAASSSSGDYVSLQGDCIMFHTSVNAQRTINFTVSDSSTPAPFTASSTITASLANAVSSANATSSSGGSGVTITFAGIPGWKYAVERSSSSTDWSGATTVQEVTVGSSGLWTYTESSPPSPSFYRSRQNEL